MFRLMRGLILVLVGIVIGIFLLANTLDEAGTSDAPAATTTTAAPTVTTAPGTDTTPTVTLPGATVPTTIDTTPTTATTIAPPLALTPSVVRFQVFNGTDVAGAAGRITNELTVQGYIGLPPSNVPEDLGAQVQSRILYEDGYLANAQLIADALGVDRTFVLPMPVPPPITTDDAHIIVIIGSDALSTRGT